MRATQDNILFPYCKECFLEMNHQKITCAPNVEKNGTQLHCFYPRMTLRDGRSHGFLAISFVYTRQKGK